MPYHNINPIFDKDSRILILGSFPSVLSRDKQFFYANPANRFWKIMSMVLCEDEPLDVPAKIQMLKTHRIALWDVVSSCDIDKSSDSSIRNVRANDIRKITDISHISSIICNGSLAKKLYDKYMLEKTKIPAVCLPSTSPANARWRTDMLYQKWKDTFDEIYKLERY